MSPATLSISPGTSATFEFSATINAEISQKTVTITASSGSITATAPLQMTVNGAPTADPFHAVGGFMEHGFYDESRQLLFAANPGLNELDVISGKDYSIQARVPMPQPWGMDQMADGKTLVIGTAAQEIITFDENTFVATAHPYSATAIASYTLFFPNVLAMANGKVFVIGQAQGIDSNDIQDGGQALYEWNSNTDSFRQIEPTQINPLWETDSLARSADHKWAAFSADQFYLYSSDSDSFVTVPLSTVNPPNNTFGVRGYAINSNGSKIAVASAEQVTFLDNSLSVIGSSQIPGAFQGGRTAVQFTPDDKKLLLQYDLPLFIDEVDASTYAQLGTLSGSIFPDSDNFERMLANDSQGRAFVGISGGIRIVDLTQPPTPMDATTTNPYPCLVPNAVAPLNSATQAQLSFAYQDLSVSIAGQSAALINGGLTLSIPASSTPGPADIVCTDTYGNTVVTLNDVSYGIAPVALSANLLPPVGNPLVYLFGYGFYGFNGIDTGTFSVTIANQAPLKTTSLGILEPGFSSLQAEAIQIPNGISGESIDIGVSDGFGNGKLSAAATYYPTPTILPTSGVLQLLFDNHRSLLYALKSNEVDILNPATLAWQSPITFPSSANAAFETMALSPDGSKLVVYGLSGSTPQFLVLDPDGAAAPSVLNYNKSGISGSIAISEYNQVFAPGDPGVILDLATSTFTPLPFFGAASAAIRASADGSRLYSAALNVSSGEVSTIDPLTYSVQSESFGYTFWTDLAVSPDGTAFAAVDAPPFVDGDFVGFFDSHLHYLNANVYPDFSSPDDTGVLGATYSPGGEVVVVALGDSIEFWDATRGTLRARLMTPEELHALVYPENGVSPMIALDQTGQTIYAASVSGITVIPLPAPLDQITPKQWPMLRRSPSDDKLQGPTSSRIAAMRTASVQKPRQKSPVEQ